MQRAWLVIFSLTLFACGTNYDALCKRVAIGAEASSFSLEAREPLGLPADDVAGPVEDLFCCGNSSPESGCTKASYDCSLAPAVANLVDEDGYTEGDGEACAVWVRDGKIVARAWAVFD